jgi:pimeloyl-ACP methyl ester carboxylesterase
MTPRRLRIFALVLAFVVFAGAGLPFLLPVRDGTTDPRTWAAPNGRFITVAGTDIYTEESGDPAGIPVVLVHGLFGSTATWRRNVPALAEAGYRVVAFDRPGFGLSDKAADFDYSVPAQADLLAQMLDALSIPAAVVVGHSAGGNVAAHFAARHPGRVRALVLVDAAALSGGPPPFVGGLVRLAPVWRWGEIGLSAFFTRERLRGVLAGFYTDPATLTEEDLDLYWRAFETPGWAAGLLGLTRDGAGASLGEAGLRAITAETLIVWGRDDTTTPLEQGERLAALLPASRLVVLDGVAHQPFEEDAAAFNRALLAFLGGVDTPFTAASAAPPHRLRFHGRG